MKAIKFIIVVAVSVGFLSSCQKQNNEGPSLGEEFVPVTLMATFDAEITKATYEETNTGGIKLQPSWEIGDKVYAFDGTQIAYSFIVSAVDATTKKATLIGVAPAVCTLHLIYVNGSDVVPTVSGGKISVSYKSQKGDDTMPAVMLADGEIRYGIGDFHFANAGAVIGIKAVKGVTSGSTISRIRISGENLSAATISIDGSGKLALSATGMSTDAISTATLSGVTVKDANGTLSTPVFIAVPAGATVDDVNAKVGTKTYTYSFAETPVTLAANQYAYVNGQQFTDPLPYVEIAGVKWARQNLAPSASGQMKWKGNGSTAVKVPETGDNVVIGDYFQWGSIANFAPENNNDRGIVIYYNFTCPKCIDGGSTYSITYKPIDSGYYEFTWTRTPFFNWENPVRYNNDDNLTRLQKGDDAANIILGGSWRMPTSAEWKSLYDNTDWTWDNADCGFYITDKGESLENDKSNALLFLPAAGYLDSYGFQEIAKGYDDDFSAQSNFWSSDRAGNPFGSLKMHYGITNGFNYQYMEPRRNGLTIRPVSD